ncbi:PDZ domain-containing protein [Alloscardovia theropitheci]|uniref:PDZ domain-containing protein n=1 Tax=Alloscardovia theropitheci TaxID=2496842 RepID=A0A4R0QXM1_9BIFI|nr:trypsin-like peptidase domain-containing protein [Alloscardovia theropitheci]TCD54380.1 PDZ domain-containing protein [Alloscardovia theropitheci]
MVDELFNESDNEQTRNINYPDNNYSQTASNNAQNSPSAFPSVSGATPVAPISQNGQFGQEQVESASQSAMPLFSEPSAYASAPSSASPSASPSAQPASNAFADPANASGTPAAVTAQGAQLSYQSIESIMKKNRRTTLWTAIGATVVTAVLMGGIGYAGIRTGVISVPSSTSLSSISSSTGAAGTTQVSNSQVNWTAVAKKVSNSVVSIQGTVSNGSVIGSGAILDAQGNIITNNHVVNGASNLQVTTANGDMYEAEVVGADATTDLAVIRLKNAPSNLEPVTFANSDDLAVGEAVMAIGSPLGYENTATSGIVSALNRPVSVASDDNGNNVVVTNAVQIDASINSGNSGGPTFNAQGQMIGINSSIATARTSNGSSSSTGSIGIGFAIPANLAKWVSSSIISNGKASHVSLGVTVQTATTTADGATRTGAQVQSVTTGSAAASAGIQRGDTIVAYDNHAVTSTVSLLGYVRATQSGSKVTVTVVRDGKVLNLSVNMNHEESVNVTPRSNNDQNSGRGNDDENNEGNSNGGSENPYQEFFGRNN